METKTTTKKLFGICYLIQVQKMYYNDEVGNATKRVTLVTRETYFFDIKIHSTQITF